MRLRQSLCLLLLISLAACGGGFTNPSKNTTETFNGVLQPGGANSHDFTVSKNGEYTVTLTQMTPTFAGFINVTVCQLISGTCQPISANQFVRMGTQAASGVIQIGSYRVFLLDQGTLTTAETYTVTVNHP